MARREGEQLHLRPVGQAQVQLPGVARLAEVFGDHFQAEDLGVEAFGALIVGADDGGVVDSLKHGAGAIGQGG